MASSVSDSDLHRRMFMVSGTQPVARIPPHRPKESLGPNQYLACTALPLSLICDSCGNRMPKCSRIAVTHDVSGKNLLDLTWSKIYVDCTNCIAEITLKRKGLKFDVLSGATPYFRPEDEKLECPGKRRMKARRVTRGNLVSSGVVSSSSSSVAASCSSISAKCD